MNTRSLRLLYAIVTICSFSVLTFAQTTPIDPTLSIKIAGDKTAFKANEQVILKAEGIDEEKTIVQWQSSADNKTWNDIPRAMGNIYETYPIAKTQYYRIVTRPAEGYLLVDTYSNAKTVALEENVALKAKGK